MCSGCTSFPSAELQFAHRDEAGKDMEGLPGANGRLPGLKLRLTRSGGKFAAAYSSGSGAWKPLGEIEDKLPSRVYAGVLALSHDNGRLTKIVYRGLRLTKK